MEWMKKMGLKKSFLLLSVAGILTSLLVIGTTFVVGETITAKYPKGGIIITDKGIVRELANPTKEQLQVINLTAWIEVLTWWFLRRWDVWEWRVFYSTALS